MIKSADVSVKETFEPGNGGCMAQLNKWISRYKNTPHKDFMIVVSESYFKRCITELRLEHNDPSLTFRFSFEKNGVKIFWSRSVKGKNAHVCINYNSLFSVPQTINISDLSPREKMVAADIVDHCSSYMKKRLKLDKDQINIFKRMMIERFDILV